jgi:hypothetical protein
MALLRSGTLSILFLHRGLRWVLASGASHLLRLHYTAVGSGRTSGTRLLFYISTIKKEKLHIIHLTRRMPTHSSTTFIRQKEKNASIHASPQHTLTKAPPESCTSLPPPLLPTAHMPMHLFPTRSMPPPPSFLLLAARLPPCILIASYRILSHPCILIAQQRAALFNASAQPMSPGRYPLPLSTVILSCSLALSGSFCADACAKEQRKPCKRCQMQHTANRSLLAVAIQMQDTANSSCPQGADVCGASRVNQFTHIANLRNLYTPEFPPTVVLTPSPHPLHLPM